MGCNDLGQHPLGVWDVVGITDAEDHVDAPLCLLEFADRRMLETQIKRLRKLSGAKIVPGTNAVVEVRVR